MSGSGTAFSKGAALVIRGLLQSPSVCSYAPPTVTSTGPSADVVIAQRVSPGTDPLTLYAGNKNNGYIVVVRDAELTMGKMADVVACSSDGLDVTRFGALKSGSVSIGFWSRVSRTAASRALILCSSFVRARGGIIGLAYVPMVT